MITEPAPIILSSSIVSGATKDEFDHNSYKGIIKSVIFSGTHTRYKISIDNIELECSLQSVGIKNIKENDKVYIHLPKNKIWGMNGW